MISINLGFINLLPVPMLDGGHFVFLRGRAVSGVACRPGVQEWAFRGGLAAVLALMLMVTSTICFVRLVEKSGRVDRLDVV